jgi:hypothetical protein
MKTSIQNKLIQLAIGASFLFIQSIASATTLPTFIYFDNLTDIKLNATVAGLPGKPIPANTSNYPVPYALVDLACYQKNLLSSCPIEFFDAENGQKVASVYIQASEGSIGQAPTLYGEYLNQFSVSGWESKPVSHIKINKKA